MTIQNESKFNNDLALGLFKIIELANTTGASKLRLHH